MRGKSADRMGQRLRSRFLCPLLYVDRRRRRTAAGRIPEGDQFGPLDIKTHNWKDTSGSADVDTADLVRFADSFSKMAKTTAIYLARIGVDGTSGDHRSRKTVLELKLVDVALDAIKRRHGFEGFHIVGQSGGSQILGGLIGLRQDIGCAIAGSGQFLTSNKNGDPSRTYFDSSNTSPTRCVGRRCVCWWSPIRRTSRCLRRCRTPMSKNIARPAVPFPNSMSKRPTRSTMASLVRPARRGRLRPRQARRRDRSRHPNACEAQPRVQRAEGTRSTSQDPHGNSEGNYSILEGRGGLFHWGQMT